MALSETMTLEQRRQLDDLLNPGRDYMFVDLDHETSFRAMVIACGIATSTGRKVRYVTLNTSREVFVEPGADPHALYKAVFG